MIAEVANFPLLFFLIWVRIVSAKERMVTRMEDPTYITLTDEDGTEIELEYVDTVEFNGCVYMSFFPVISEEEENGEEDGLIILKVVSDNGEEEELVTIDDEQELNAVYDLFMEALFEDEEE